MCSSQVVLEVKNLPAGNLREVGSILPRDLLIPGLGRSPAGGHSKPLQCVGDLEVSVHFVTWLRRWIGFW